MAVIDEDKDPVSAEQEAPPDDEPVVSDEDDDGDEVVLDPMEQVAALEEQLATERDRLLRTAAELDNFRKRARRDVSDAAVRGRSEVLTELLPAIDSIDLALASPDPDGAAKGVLEGIEMVRRQFLGAMERFELKPVESTGKRFDPAFHEAVAQLPSTEHDEGTVAQEMRKGYVLGERLLRAAMVVVSSGPPVGDDPAPTGDDDEAAAIAGSNEEADPEAAVTAADSAPTDEEAQDE